MSELNPKTEVVATRLHPNRPEGQHYLLTTALVETLRARGFVVLPEEVGKPDPIMPRAVKIIKPKAKAKAKK